MSIDALPALWLRALLLIEMTEWPWEDKWAATAEPIRPVPPIMAIFMTDHSSSHQMPAAVRTFRKRAANEIPSGRLSHEDKPIKTLLPKPPGGALQAAQQPAV